MLAETRKVMYLQRFGILTRFPVLYLIIYWTIKFLQKEKQISFISRSFSLEMSYTRSVLE